MSTKATCLQRNAATTHVATMQLTSLAYQGDILQSLWLT